MATRPTGSGSEGPKKTRDQDGCEATGPGNKAPPRPVDVAGTRRASSKPRRPWQRRDRESSPAFGAATLYFDLGPERSLREVAKACRRSFSLIGRWSVQWDWVERARAYDDYVAQTWQEEKERALVRRSRQWIERREELRDREWRAAASLLDLAEKILVQDMRYRGSYTARDAADLLEKASALARRAAGMPTRLSPDGKPQVAVNPPANEPSETAPKSHLVNSQDHGATGTDAATDPSKPCS